MEELIETSNYLDSSSNLKQEENASPTKEIVSQKVLRYIKLLKLPKKFDINQATLAVILLVNRKVESRNYDQYRKILGLENYKLVLDNFENIFKVNTMRQRVQFFRDPLASYMWSQFRVKSYAFFTHITKIIKNVCGPER